MALCHCPSFLSTSQNVSSFRGSLLKVQEQPKWKTLQIPSCTCTCRITVTAVSAKTSRVSKKPKGGRPTRSNEELCNELREFIAMNRLSENCIPSLKELSAHGRKDLANIVRRRGYRLILELLISSTKVEINTMRNLDENQDATDDYENESTEGHDKRLNGLINGTSSSFRDFTVEDDFPSADGGLANSSGFQFSESVESSVSSSSHKLAANFVRNGKLDMIEDNTADEGERCLKMDDKMETDCGKPVEEESLAQSNGNGTVSRLDTGLVASEKIDLSSKEGNSQTDDSPLKEGADNQDTDVEGKQGSKREKQVEIDCLKAMLRQKELELSHLKQQIESEKLVLSSLQSKVQTEIGNAQRTISEKDAELQAVEESLSGLKEVQIEYHGNGEIVEVAGSFNGWHHPIKMDLSTSSETVESTVSR